VASARPTTSHRPLSSPGAAHSGTCGRGIVTARNRKSG
jgi:hypothetical protein